MTCEDKTDHSTVSVQDTLPLRSTTDSEVLLSKNYILVTVQREYFDAAEGVICGL
jgi:hypothetical protein